VTRAPRRSALAPGRLRLLLLSLLLLFVGTGAAAGTGRGRAIEGPLMVLVIVAAVWDLRERGRERLVAAALGAGAILLGVLDLTVRIRHLPVVASAIVAVLAGLVVWRAYTGVMRPERSVSERILGAVCVYLLIGLAWAKIYETLDVVTPGSFRFPADNAWAAPGLARYAYLSFITLATVGYGDVTPATPIAGTITWLEAVTGQLYLAITVARLVALSLAEGRGSDTAARS
jgi:voltage-gated potassium channel